MLAPDPDPMRVSDKPNYYFVDTGFYRLDCQIEIIVSLIEAVIGSIFHLSLAIVMIVENSDPANWYIMLGSFQCIMSIIFSLV